MPDNEEHMSLQLVVIQLVLLLLELFVVAVAVVVLVVFVLKMHTESTGTSQHKSYAKNVNEAIVHTQAMATHIWERCEQMHGEPEPRKMINEVLLMFFCIKTWPHQFRFVCAQRS